MDKPKDAVPLAKVTESDHSSVMIRLENVSKYYGSFCALDHVSFEVHQGEVLGLLGPNGAGKTTALRVLTGFFPPSSGKVWVDGEVFAKKPVALKEKIGYLPESVSLYNDMRIQEFLSFAAAVKGLPRGERRAQVDEKLTQCGLWDYRFRLIGRLSRGLRQRAGLAQALLGDPPILVLDEPTNGLDPKQIIEIRNLIRELGEKRTLILSTHILPEVSMVCDRVLIVNQGKVVASGTTEELEAGLRDRHEVFVMMGDRFRKDEAIALLQSISGIEKIAVCEEKDDSVTFSISVGKDHDVRPTISKLFVEKQIPLLEMKSGKLSLEEIFLRIVVSEKSMKDFL